MGTLGTYLREAREALGIDIRDAAQRTRIGLRYLKALEAEDFAGLPGEVFTRGFLKNYGKFLHLDEHELVKRYEELRPKLSRSGDAAATDRNRQGRTDPLEEQESSPRTPLEPFLWAAGLLIALILFLFAALPARHQRDVLPAGAPPAAGQVVSTPSVSAPKTDKLYLEVVALENTWVLVRTDVSPQKKAVLKKGESLTWSADERFQLSYGSAGALKLSLNGRELSVNEAPNVVIRDLVIAASGIISRNMQPEYARPARRKRKPEAPLQQAQPTMEPQRTTLPPQVQPSEQLAAPEPQRALEAVPQPPAVSPQAQVQPASPESQPTSSP